MHSTLVIRLPQHHQHRQAASITTSQTVGIHNGQDTRQNRQSTQSAQTPRKRFLYHQSPSHHLSAHPKRQPQPRQSRPRRSSRAPTGDASPANHLYDLHQTSHKGLPHSASHHRQSPLHASLNHAQHGSLNRLSRLPALLPLPLLLLLPPLSHLRVSPPFNLLSLILSLTLFCHKQRSSLHWLSEPFFLFLKSHLSLSLFGHCLDSGAYS